MVGSRLQLRVLLDKYELIKGMSTVKSVNFKTHMQVVSPTFSLYNAQSVSGHSATIIGPVMSFFH